MKTEIESKLDSLRHEYQFLTKEKNDYVFSASLVQSIFFKNPSHFLDDETLKTIIVSGPGEGSVNCVLNDLDSNHKDMIVISCKYKENVSFDDLKNTLKEMLDTYNQSLANSYTGSKELINQFIACNYEMEEKAKVYFYLCIPQSSKTIKKESIYNYFDELVGENSNISLVFYLENDIIKQYIEFDSLRRAVNIGRITIDKENNYLRFYENLKEYGKSAEDAVILNGSALSLKDLYVKHHLALFSKNMRFLDSSKKMDEEIRESIKVFRDKFWYKNNGITILCEDFYINGRELQLKGFSIVNGSQTVSSIGNSEDINEGNNFYVPIKVIKLQGSDEIKTHQFTYDVTISSNYQKLIKKVDLKANEPEQLLFAIAMYKIGIFYVANRGESIPVDFVDKEKHCDLEKVAKLALTGIYLNPAMARNNSSALFCDNQTLYDGVFVTEREKSAAIIKDLLFIDNYFEKVFKTLYPESNKNKKRNVFSFNSKALCLAYVSFIAKYLNNQFSESEIMEMSNLDIDSSVAVNNMQKLLGKIDSINGIFSPAADQMKEEIENVLFKIMSFICKQGFGIYENLPELEKIGESNWLRKDTTFCKIVSRSLDDLEEFLDENPDIAEVF